MLLRKPNRLLEEPSSYRPLCMLDSLGKLLEKVVDKRLKLICERNNLLTANQYDFRQGESTMDTIAHIMQIINIGMQTKTMVGILMLDVKNAFNLVPWHVIAALLRSKGVPGYLCRLIDDYFNGRVLTYEVSGNTETVELFTGVPQGSVLRPTLWNYDSLLRLPISLEVELVAYAR